MRRTFIAGVGVTAAGLVGYAAGVAAAYPGRELSLVGIMIGITLTSVGLGGDGE